MEGYGYSYGYNDYGYADYGSAASSAGSVLGVLAGVMIFIWIIVMATAILQIVSMWKVFKKAGKPGWESILPVHNIFVMCEIALIPTWYVLLFFVPFVNIYAMFMVYNGIAKKFGKSTGFTIGMMLVPIIFWPILAFSKSSMVNTSVEQNNNYVSQSNLSDYAQANSFTQEQITQSQTGESVQNMEFATQFNNVTPNMQQASEPVMQNAFDSSANQMMETMQESTENVTFDNGLNNANSNVMQFNDQPMQQPVMQNSFDVPTEQVVNPMQTGETVQNMGFANQFDNVNPITTQFNGQPTQQKVVPNAFNNVEAQSNPNDIFNNQNGNM